MKKSISLLLAGILALSLVGCNKPAPSVSETSTPDTSIEVSVSTSEPEPQPEPEPEEEYYLKELFASHGLKVGTCFNPQFIVSKDQSSLVLNQFTSITMENAMKPDYIFNKQESISKGKLVVEFNSDVVKMLDWAKANGMAVRGHTIVWHSQTPDWIFYNNFDKAQGFANRDVMLERLENYIKDVFQWIEDNGYTEVFYAYDIVNEAWMEDGTMRQSNWLQTIGEDYLWQAFYFANKYAPESIDLYYNDYNEQFKTNTLVDFVNTLVDDDGNYLIDGVGFQAHLYTSDNLTDYFKTMDAVAATGLKIQLTELDVCLGAYTKPLIAVEENTKAQGRFYYDLINGIFERVDNGSVKMDSLTFWGFADNLSWRKEYSPLLFNRKLEPKFAFYGAMQIKDRAGFE